MLIGHCQSHYLDERHQLAGFPYFILHFGKALLSGQPLLSGQLAHSLNSNTTLKLLVKVIFKTVIRLKLKKHKKKALGKNPTCSYVDFGLNFLTSH